MASDQPVVPPPKPQSNRRRWLFRLAAFGAVLTVAGLVLGLFARRSSLSPDDPPETTYRKIYDAYGGTEALDRWRCGVLKYEALNEDVQFRGPGVAPTETALMTETFHLPGRVRYDLETLTEPRSKLSSAVNGEMAWEVTSEGKLRFRPAHPAEEGDYPPFLKSFHPHAFLHGGVGLSVVGVERRPDGGRDLIIDVTGTGPPHTRCYVDTRTKLLREARGRVPEHFKAEDESRVEFSDYRRTEGGMVPGRITWYIGERRIFEHRFISVEFRDSVDSSLFEPPNLERQP